MGKANELFRYSNFAKNRIESVYVELGDISKWEANMLDPLDNIGYIRSTSSYCLSEITGKSFKNKTVSFASGCARIGLGMTYEFVTQNKGGLDTVRFKFNGYDKKIDMHKYHSGIWTYIPSGQMIIYFLPMMLETDRNN